MKNLVELTIPQPEDTDLAATSSGAIAMAKAFEVSDVPSMQLAADELQAVQGRIKKLEAKREELKRPILEAGRGVDNLFRPAIEALQAGARVLKSAILTFQQAEQKREKEQATARAAEATAKNLPAPIAPAPAPLKVAGLSTRGVWKFEVTDKMALIKAVAAGEQSERLLEVSSIELGIRARALKDEARIPGVRIYEEASLSARATS